MTTTVGADGSGFEAIEFTTWEDAYSFASRLDEFVFRGHADAGWKPESSLARAIGVTRADTCQWDHCERWMMRSFQGAAHHFLPHVPDEDDLIEWLALMQHHGAPTRLLDCTYSFPVAAFFGARDAAADYFAVWGFNWRHLRQSVVARFDIEKEVGTSSYRFHAEMHVKANEFLSGGASGALVFPVDPKRQNERRAAQQGLFLFPGDRSRSFLDNLLCLFPDIAAHHINGESPPVRFDASTHNGRGNWQLKVVKLILPRGERFKTLTALRSMNIHEASLFPGLDGFARSLCRYTYRPDEPDYGGAHLRRSGQ
jgi:hypothetical protein